jgi:hypothetical protein
MPQETKEYLSATEIDYLHQEWEATVYDRAEEVDIQEMYTWEGVALGWMLRAGIPLEQAKELLLSDRWKH